MDEFLPTKIMDLLIDTICVVDEAGRFVYISASGERLLGYAPEELIGRNMIELVHPEDRARTLSMVDEIMDGEPAMHFENRYIRKDGGVVHIMWSARWSASDRLRFAVARDVTEIRRVNLVRSALYEISEASHHSTSLDALCRRIHEIVAGLLPATDFQVALYEPDTDRWHFPYAVSETHDPEAVEPFVPDGDSLIDLVVRTGQIQVSPALRPVSSASTSGDWLAAPLITQRGVIGAIALRTRADHPQYTGEDRELLQFVSAQIATVIERKQAETRLEHMALHDPLTGLPNRTLFYDRFDMALEHARRTHGQLALLFLDLDDFKSVNDGFGHDVGDRLLCEVAARLRRTLRAEDAVGRMGGDEFTVLLTHMRDHADARQVGRKLMSVLAEPFLLDGARVTLGTSIGMACYPDDGDTRETLFRKADAHMYVQKHSEAAR